ncbi:MAG: FAD synthetase family protein [Erysipelotrichaceae bacterium]|nr:FAD synthetase family protein [Erysipelotrichaceae bacterium]
MIPVYYFKEDLDIPANVACIGSFDGVHKGHQELIKRTIELSDKNSLTPMAITFDPDPAVVIGNSDHYGLTDLNRRIELFERFGIKGVIVIPFDEYVMKLSIDDFKAKILDKLNNKILVCGFDFTYGFKGMGNTKTLIEQGVEISVVDECLYDGQKISSTRIRKELLNGNIELANELLGYEYNK